MIKPDKNNLENRCQIRVLLLDGDVSVLTSVALALRSSDFNVTAATDVAEIQHELSSGYFHVAVVDVNGSEERDLQIVLRLQAAAPRLPFILLTADSEQMTNHPLVRQARAWFPKPLLDFSVLIKEIAETAGRATRPSTEKVVTCL